LLAAAQVEALPAALEAAQKFAADKLQ